MPFPSPEDLPDLGIEPASSALAGRFFTTLPPGSPTDPRGDGIRTSETLAGDSMSKAEAS